MTDLVLLRLITLRASEPTLADFVAFAGEGR